MNNLLMDKRTSFIICTLIGALGFLALAGYYLLKRQADLESRWHEVRHEFVPAREAVNVKPQVIERVVSSACLWRPVQERIKDTVVQIVAQVAEIDMLQPYKTPAQGTAQGTGFFINDQGDIITNAHVVDQAKSVWIQIPSLGKRIIDAHIVGVSPERDIALLRVNGDDVETIRRELGTIPYLPLGDSDLIRRSDEVLAVGYPLGQQSLKSTTGVVSGREQHLIQTSAPINPGNSGGPLLNPQGEVIGINVANIPQAQNVGYAIPINELRTILPDLYKVKLLRKPCLGVLFNNGTEALAEYFGNPRPCGCYVVDVVRGSALEKAGVASGDMVYEINGYPVDMFGEMSMPWSEDKLSIVDYVSRLAIGENIRVVVYRYGERKEFSFKFDLAELPAIRKVYPGFEDVDYEVFSGMVVMQLTKNHFQLLGPQAPGLARFGEIKAQSTPALVVTHIFPSCQLYRARNVALGSTINEVNGIKVGTLEEFRGAIRKSAQSKLLVFKFSDNVSRVSDNIMIALPWEKVMEEESRLAKDFNYVPTQLSCEMVKLAQANSAIKGGITRNLPFVA